MKMNTIAFLLLLLPSPTNAILDFLFNPINAIIASFIDESAVCDNLGDVIPGVSCDECTAELVSDGIFDFKLVAEAACVAGLADVTVTAESDSVAFWEPFLGGGIGVFDPFSLSTSASILGSPDLTIDSEANLFSDPPDFSLTGADLGGVGCTIADTLIQCGIVCFDALTLATTVCI